MNQIAFEMKGKCLYINTVVQHFNEKVTFSVCKNVLKKAMKTLVSP